MLNTDNDASELLMPKGFIFAGMPLKSLSAYYLLHVAENTEIDNETRAYIESNKDRFLKEVGVRK